MAQMESRDRLGHKIGFTVIKSDRLPVCHGAKTTISSAFVTEYKERRGAPGRTFPLVGASGLSANGVKALSVRFTAHLGNRDCSGQRCVNPMRESARRHFWGLARGAGR